MDGAGGDYKGQCQQCHAVLFGHRTIKEMLMCFIGSYPAEISCHNSKKGAQPSQFDSESTCYIPDGNDEQCISKTVGHIVIKISVGAFLSSFNGNHPIEQVAEQPRLHTNDEQNIGYIFIEAGINNCANQQEATYHSEEYTHHGNLIGSDTPTS